MTRRRLAIWGAALAVVGLLALLLLMPRPAQVETMSVKRAEAVRVLAVNGRIRPRQSIDVKSPVAGTLLTLPYDVGEQVAAGAPLARVDDGPQRAAIAEAAAAVSAQEAVVAQARRELARFEALGEFVSRRQVEAARLEVVEGARELERRHAARVEAQEVQQRYVVRAPFSGVILERPVDRGQTVSPETVLYRLADLTAPEVAAEVDEIYAVELRTGMSALVVIAGRERPLRAEVAHIEPRVDEATGAREVRLRLLDPLDNAPSGQTVSVNLVVERRAQAISIPRAAILSPDSNPRVRVIGDDGRVAERRVRFIDWPATEVIVTAGLEQGTIVLADPLAAAPGERAEPAR
jgi:RND family efflux transporter MFP subunit